jgi:hypothetical protein
MNEEIKKQTQIFEGGPTLDEVEAWREEFGNVYYIEFKDIAFFYRALSRAEYKTLSTIMAEPLDREEKLCEMCVLWPTDVDFSGTLAGIPTIIAEDIMEQSGFNPSAKAVAIEDLLE